MGIDVRTSRNGHFDRNKWYKGLNPTKTKLTPAVSCEGVFYSTDNEPMTVSNATNGTMMIKAYTLSIVTTDVVTGLEPNDFVLYGGDGEMWIVESITPDDNNPNKQFSSRPANKTIIKLRR